MKVCVIKVDPTPGNEAGLLRINDCDFDPTKHTLVCIEGEELVVPTPAEAEPGPTGPAPTNPEGDSGDGVDAGEGGDLPATEGQDTSAPSPKTGKKKKG